MIYVAGIKWVQNEVVSLNFEEVVAKKSKNLNVFLNVK